MDHLSSLPRLLALFVCPGSQEERCRLVATGNCPCRKNDAMVAERLDLRLIIHAEECNPV
ncbi:MAG: hypothetical protein Q8O31_09100 [Rhodocyclaceae bacterium]|nr:hypothetical protein [Rhodocyclaceae bacterium]